MASTYLTRTPGSGNTSRYKGTLSVWLKRAKTDEEDFIFNGFESSSNQIKITFKSNAQLQINTVQAGSNRLVYETNRLFRDTNAWYHIVVAIDTTLATAGDRCRLYVNGVEETSFSTETHIAQNSLSFLTEDSQPIYIGAQQGSGNFFDGSMSHFHLIDGTQYTASTFGSTDSTTGEWKINTSPSVTYGNHGFFILKDGNSVTDQSGEGNNLTVGGGTLTKTEDNPSNNFATFNRLIGVHSNQGALVPTLDAGNTDAWINSAQWRIAQSTLAASSGKYYLEIKKSNDYGTDYAYIGIWDIDAYAQKITGYPLLSDMANCFGIRSDNGDKYVSGSASSYGSGWTTNDVICIALDLDNSKLYFRKNNDAWFDSGDPTSGSTGTGAISITANKTYAMGLQLYNSAYRANFGNGYFGTTAVSSAGTNASNNGIFEFDVPTGYTALSTKGLNT